MQIHSLHTHIYVFVSNRHGTGISVRCMRPYDEYRQFTPNPEKAVRADVWLTVFYFDKVPTGCQVSNAGTDVCVCVCARSSVSSFLIPAESTLNTYCLINNHCIRSAFICVHSQ